MGKRILLLLFVVMCSAAVMNADELVRFDKNNFTYWDYTRPGFTITITDVTTDKVNLYKGTTDYTLISPVFEKGRAGKIVVNFKGKSTRYNNSNYNAYNGSPTIELLDNDGNVLKSVFYEFVDNVRDRQFSVSFMLQDIEENELKVRIACWKADTYCALSVNEVVVENDLLQGDVDGDGTITAADITALYNYLLNNDDSDIVYGDVDGDGIITAADVTLIYNKLLE